jgi:hypothetical protein
MARCLTIGSREGPGSGIAMSRMVLGCRLGARKLYERIMVVKRLLACRDLF